MRIDGISQDEREKILNLCNSLSLFVKDDSPAATPCHSSLIVTSPGFETDSESIEC